MTATGELAVWIETQREAWRDRGVDVLEYEGKVLFGPYDPGETMSRFVFFGDVEACLSFGTLDPCAGSKFIPLIILGDMSVEHSKILIENAIEQVAGR